MYVPPACGGCPGEALPLEGVMGGGLIVTEGLAVGVTRGGSPAAALAAACICWARLTAAASASTVGG